MTLLQSIRGARGAALSAALAAGLGAAALGAFAPEPARAQPLGAPVSFADLAERLSPAVVNISTAQTVTGPNRAGPQLPPGTPFEDFFRDFFNRRGGGPDRSPRRVQSLGSGFVIDPTGFVVTNNHVIEDADEIEVNFSDGSSLPATLVGRDPKTDLALLKVDPEDPLPAVAWGESEDSRVGDWVLAIGNPFGLGGSVSAGIISARNRDINAGPYDDFLQTDAAINRGNSGGPLFNTAGDVIGVNTAIISPSGGSIGIGFSVPSSLAKSVIRQLKDFGETRRGWLGVRIQSVDDAIAESIGLDGPRGALVAGVDPDGPSSAAGIEPGDVIVTFDGRAIESMRDLPRIVADTPVGDEVAVELFRDGAVKVVDVTIALLDEEATAAAAGDDDAPAITPDDATAVQLGMTLEALGPEARTKYTIPDSVDGVLVAAVERDSSAFERGVRAGDVLVEVALEEVDSPAEAAERIEEARETGRDAVLLMLNRAGELRFVAVKFEK